MMNILRGAALALVLLVAGTWGLSQATDGFRAFTSQTARAVQVRAHPRAVPHARFQDQGGAHWAWDELAGKWLVVDFMYTHCVTLCTVMGSKFAQLQQQLATPLATGQVQLLSISFDPGRDAPVALADYLQRYGRRGDDWLAVRPGSDAQLHELLRGFGITVIPDGMGGYEHNDGFAIVNPRGELVDIADSNSPSEAVAALVRKHMERL